MATHHVIIGGGPAATNAIETIRQLEQSPSQITLVSDEPAHSRMALPYWLSGEIPREQTHTADESVWRRLNVQALIGRRAERLDPGSKTVTLNDGQQLAYDNLLLATGSTPLVPSLEGADLPGVLPLWRIEHVEAVLKAADAFDRPRAALIGAGFIGFIVLGAMYKKGWSLTVVEREPQLLPKMLDRDAAAIVADWLAERGVDVHCGAEVQAIRPGGNGAKQVELAGGQQLEADIVILAVGVRPNTELAAAAGLDVDHGILVDERMRTSAPGVYAAGDAAQGPTIPDGEQTVHAIHPTAVDHGRVAGANMAGRDVRYPGSLSMNVVDVCGLQCASFGIWDSAEDTMTINNRSGRVYRRLSWRGDRIVGAQFVGRPEDAGLLTDVGMVKGLIQTQTPLGEWKAHLAKHPFDVRRAYVGAGVAAKLAAATLLGEPSRDRSFRFDGVQPAAAPGATHQTYVETKHAP